MDSNLLCVWSIEKNIIPKRKAYIDTKECWKEFLAAWNRVVYSSIEELYKQAWHEIELLYKEKGDITFKRHVCPIKSVFLVHGQKIVCTLEIVLLQE